MMKIRHLPIMFILVLAMNTAYGDPVCSTDFADKPMTGEIINGTGTAWDWELGWDALHDIQTDVIDSLANAHGEWLISARRDAVKSLQEKTLPIQRTLMRERIILYRYAADVAGNDLLRNQALDDMRIAQEEYCRVFSNTLPAQ
jgi:hypothetical protein